MASSDFLENAISSKIDEKSLNDLASSLDTQTNSLASAPSVGGQRRLVIRTAAGQRSGGQAPVTSGQILMSSGQPAPQRLVMKTPGASQPRQIMMSGGQRLVVPGGQVIVAPPGQQLVRTSGGQISRIESHTLYYYKPS